jgi:glycosyltransferase involved in cell wall biosynthesis
MRVSVIIPVLNEESCLEQTLWAVSALNPWELIVADGGSTDRTVSIASKVARVVRAPRGRGAQQRAAAKDANGDVLWFLHADTTPGIGALGAITSCLRDGRIAGGNFSLRFDGGKRSARQLTRIYPWLRLLDFVTGIPASSSQERLLRSG